MEQAPTYLLIILYLIGFLSTYIAARVKLRSRVPAASEFFLMMLAISFYVFGYAVEISRTDISGVLQAINMEYVGLAFIPTLLFLFAYHYTYKKPLPTKYTIPVLVIPVITLLLVFTQKFHHFFYIDPHMINGGYFQVLDFDPGIWYFINFAYQNAMSIAAIILFILQARRSKKGARHQAIAAVIAAVIPIAGAILYLFDLIPGGVDPGPFSLSFAAIILAVGIFRLGNNELVPAAREFALDSIRDALMVVDKDCRIQDMNRAARQLPGANKLVIGEEMPKKNPFARYLAGIIDRSHEELTFSFDGSDGNIQYYQAKAYHIETKMPQETGIVILINDITDKANLMKMGTHKGVTDELTGLLNRRQLIRLGDNEIKRSRQKGTPLGIILIDLNRINDADDDHGLNVGDLALKQITQCLSSGLRDVDIIGRYDGEEFVIFLPNTDIDLAKIIANRLRKKVEELEIIAAGKLVNVSASFGVHATVANSLTTIDTLINEADKALKLAKMQGTNQVVLSSEVSAERK